MKKYITLLRGIDISGKNKVSMTELKKGSENLAFEEVKTYLNSGNMIFSSDEDDTKRFTAEIEGMIKNQFGLEIPVLVISGEILKDILHSAPDWWGNGDKEVYDNLIFMIPPVKFSDVYHEIGEPKKDLEKIKDYEEVIFWPLSRRDYQKTNWWSKTTSADVNAKLTIRTANTVRKIIRM